MRFGAPFEAFLGAGEGSARIAAWHFVYISSMSSASTPSLMNFENCASYFVGFSSFSCSM